MKHRFFAAALAVATLCAMRSPAGSATPGLFSGAFVNAQAGWVGGDGAIFATTDGGRHWKRQYAGHDRIDALSFVDARTGWAAGINPIRGTGVLLGTTDGGAHWNALAVPAHPLRSIDFADAHNGIGTSGGSLASLSYGDWGTLPFTGGKIALTRDGGHSWIALDTPQAADSACMGDTQHAFIAYQASVQATRDGGRTWHHVLAANIDPYRSWAARVACAGPTVAWVLFETAQATTAGQGRPYLLYRTTDGGITWQPVLENGGAQAAYRDVQAPPGRFLAPGPFGISGADFALTLGFSADNVLKNDGVTAAITTDGGSTWQQLGTIGGFSTTARLALVVLDARHAWIVGGKRSQVYATADGGRTWTARFVR